MSAEPSTPKQEPVEQNAAENAEKAVPGAEKKGKTPVVVPLKHETPAAVRNRRHIQAELHIGSPSDNTLSPCSSKIFGKRTGISGPAAILRNKQQSTIPFKMDDEVDE
uniref:PEST proteolytic signal-containing nuclear protein n=1 Tax=Caenorhabditis tropicalis TaxID=1561998 RepID=A0A1I7USR7_9PELO